MSRLSAELELITGLRGRAYVVDLAKLSEKILSMVRRGDRSAVCGARSSKKSQEI